MSAATAEARPSGRETLLRATSDVFAQMLLFRGQTDRERPTVASLRSQVLGLLEGMAKHPDVQRVPAGDVDEARFALVAWIDETVNTSGWSSATEWETEPLQYRLYRTRNAGHEFFEHLGKLRPENAAALEIYFHCLALGFCGEYGGREPDRQLLISKTVEKLRHVRRAWDGTREKRFTPTAYDVQIDLGRPKGFGLLKPLWLGLAGLALTWALLWGVLTWFATRVPNAL